MINAIVGKPEARQTPAQLFFTQRDGNIVLQAEVERISIPLMCLVAETGNWLAYDLTDREAQLLVSRGFKLARGDRGCLQVAMGELA